MASRGFPQRDQSIIFALCSDVPVYVFCSMSIIRPSPAFHLMFSTVSEVRLLG